MQENEVNWGYYYDHDPNSPHSNAHPCNFVVIPDFMESNNIIAPLDYDLAFFK